MAMKEELRVLVFSDNTHKTISSIKHHQVYEGLRGVLAIKTDGATAGLKIGEAKEWVFTDDARLMAVLNHSPRKFDSIFDAYVRRMRRTWWTDENFKEFKRERTVTVSLVSSRAMQRRDVRAPVSMLDLEAFERLSLSC